MTKVSVAIPVYNRAGVIHRTLDSIVNQSYPVDEIVICDDGSTDDLSSALAKYGELVKVIRIENSGPGKARKTAVEACQNEWIALCDSDDIWFIDHISNFVNAKCKHSFGLYVANFVHNEDKKTKLEFAPAAIQNKFKEPKVFEKSEVLADLLSFQLFFQSAMIFNKSAYDSIAGINEDYSRWLSEDLHFTLRLVCATSIYFLPKATVSITKGDENFSGDFISTLDGEIKVLNELVTEVPKKHFDEISKELHQRRRSLFKQYYWKSDFSSAINEFKLLEHSNKISIKEYLILLMCIIKRKG